jgi:hypothetical protein
MKVNYKIIIAVFGSLLFITNIANAQAWIGLEIRGAGSLYETDYGYSNPLELGLRVDTKLDIDWAVSSGLFLGFYDNSFRVGGESGLFDQIVDQTNVNVNIPQGKQLSALSANLTGLTVPLQLMYYRNPVFRFKGGLYLHGYFKEYIDCEICDIGGFTELGYCDNPDFISVKEDLTNVGFNASAGLSAEMLLFRRLFVSVGYRYQNFLSNPSQKYIGNVLIEGLSNRHMLEMGVGLYVIRIKKKNL